MAAASNYMENEILDHVLKGDTWSKPATIYMALFISPTAGDLEAGTLTSEVANSNGYARTAVTFGTVASGGTISNSADSTFPAANGGNWGTVTHAAIMDGNTHGSGNVLFHGALTASKTINDGDTFRFNAGDIDVSLD